MLVATLLTNPAAEVLDEGLLDATCRAFGGGEVRWLMPRVAAEFDTSVRPENFDLIWNDLQAKSVDLVLQPRANRRKKILLADMDSTMIEQECIDELAAHAGVGAHVAAITVRAMNGEIDFETALRGRVFVLKGVSSSVTQTVLDNCITFMPGGDVLLSTMKAQGAYAALVSGGFTAFTTRVAAHLGFDEHRANVLLEKDGVFLGTVQEPILGQDAKVAALQDITARLGLSADDVLAVGDGANDLGMLEMAGTGVALHAKPAVQKRADIRINHGDLTALLFLQGYASSEFVSP